MTRDQGLRLIEKYENKRPASLDIFLELLNLSEEEFNDIALSVAVPPYEHDFSTTEAGEKLADHDCWSRAGIMPRKITDAILAARKNNHV